MVLASPAWNEDDARSPTARFSRVGTRANAPRSTTPQDSEETSRGATTWTFRTRRVAAPPRPRRGRSERAKSRRRRGQEETGTPAVRLRLVLPGAVLGLDRHGPVAIVARERHDGLAGLLAKGLREDFMGLVAPHVVDLEVDVRAADERDLEGDAEVLAGVVRDDGLRRLAA